MANLETPEQQVRNAIATYGRPNWVAEIPMSVIRQVDKKLLEEIITSAGAMPIKKVTDKYSKMEQWCLQNVGAEVSAYSLADDFGMSAPTTRKWINSRVDLFRKVREGVWVIRDVQNERLRDKNLDTPFGHTLNSPKEGQ